MASKGLIDFEAVRDQTDFAAVLAHYEVAVPSGRTQIKVLCPLPGHTETKPSCSINLRGKVFHCFGCGKSGNVIDFAMLMEGAGSPVEGARRLGAICGFDLPKKAGGGSERPVRGHRKPQDARKGSRTAKDGSAPDDGPVEPSVADPEAVAVNPPLTFTLRLDPEHEYGCSRGDWLTPEVIAEFGMGFCSRGLMKGRWCIPIHDQHGEVVAYVGRWVGDDDTLPEGEGKYKLPARDRFDRGLELFNLHRAAKVDRAHAWVVEGYFGAMRLHAELREPVVATMGNSVSDAQIALLKSHFDAATVLYDGGENGRAAADRAALRLCRAGLFTAIADLPDGEQPDTVEKTVLRELLA